jgi:hypothetical protein
MKAVKTGRSRIGGLKRYRNIRQVIAVSHDNYLAVRMKRLVEQREKV